MSWTVGEVARGAHVSIRLLHHYDGIGLSGRPDGTAAGYRLYEPDDLARLQQVLCYRGLGFALDDIATILDDPEVDALEHLRRQKELLTDRIDELQRMVASVERTMEARRMGINLTPDEMFEVFGDTDLRLDEAEQRWGDATAWQQSQQRTASYTKDDWLRITAQGEDVTDRAVAAMAGGVPSTDPRAMDLAEEHRAHIVRWFWECRPEMHRGLAGLYRDDPRYTDKQPAGFGPWFAAAMEANADRQAGA